MKKIKFNYKGKTFKESFGLSIKKMNKLANKESSAENTEQVHLARAILALDNSNGRLPLNVIAAAYSNNASFNSKLKINVHKTKVKTIEQFVKQVGHEGLVKLNYAIESNNKLAKTIPQSKAIALSLEDFLKNLGKKQIEKKDKKV